MKLKVCPHILDTHLEKILDVFVKLELLESLVFWIEQFQNFGSLPPFVPKMRLYKSVLCFLDSVVLNCRYQCRDYFYYQERTTNITIVTSLSHFPANASPYSYITWV